MSNLQINEIKPGIPVILTPAQVQWLNLLNPADVAEHLKCVISCISQVTEQSPRDAVGLSNIAMGLAVNINPHQELA